MYVLIQQHVHILFTVVACPHTGPAKEETLVGSEALDHAVVTRIVECLQSNMQSAVVTDVLAERHLAVHLLAIHHFDGREIVGQTGGALVEGGFVGSRPPVALVARDVKLTALIVETVAHLVTYHAADGSIVLSVVGLHIEERGLQNTGREAYLVGSGIIIGVDGLGCHVPLLLIYGLVHLAVKTVNPFPFAHVS